MKNTGRTVFSVTIVTLLSRFLSLISVQLYMSCYGAGDASLNIFVYSLRIPNLIFTCLGTTLTTIVVPMYSSALAKDDGRADVLLNNIVSITGLLNIMLVGVGLAVAPVFPMFSAYRGDAESFGLAVSYLRTLMPVMFFYGMTYVFQGMLQSRGRFLAPAAVSISSSLIVILYIVFLGEKYGVTGLSVAMLIALASQAFFLVPSVIKTGYRYRPSFNFKDPDIVRAAKMALPVLAGVSAYQFNMLFNVSMSTHFGAVALLSYVQELLIVSVLSFIYSVTAVYFPRLTRAWASDDLGGYRNSLVETISTALFFLIPISLGLILLRYQVFDLLARWQNFSEADMLYAGDFMGLYALGAVAMGLKEILDKGFYAQKNTRIPAMVGFLIMFVNIVFSLIFIRVMGVYALPLSYSVSSTAGVCVLLVLMRKKSGRLGGKLFSDTVKCVISAAVMGCVIAAEMRFLNPVTLNNQILTRAVKLLVPVATGAAVYFALAYLLGVSYMRKGRDRRALRHANVLYLINHAGAGGTEGYVLDLATHYKNGRAAVAYNESGRLCDLLKEHGVDAVQISMRHPFDVKAARAVVKLCISLDIGIIHAQFAREAYIAVIAKLIAAAKKLPSLRVVYTFHINIKHNAVWRLINRLLSPTLDAVIAVCSESLNVLAANKIKAATTVLIHNGVNPDPPSAGTAGSGEGVPYSEGAPGANEKGETFVFLTLTRFTPEKGAMFLLKGAAELKKRTDKPFRLLIAGDGPQRDELLRYASEHGLSAETEFLGFRGDKDALLDSADAYVNTSESECLSIAILEALSHNLPVIATRVGGNVDIVNEETGCGITVEYGDAHALAAAMQKVMENSRLRQAMSENARRAVKERFSEEKMRAETFELYKELMK